MGPEGFEQQKGESEPAIDILSAFEQAIIEKGGLPEDFRFLLDRMKKEFAPEGQDVPKLPIGLKENMDKIAVNLVAGTFPDRLVDVLIRNWREKLTRPKVIEELSGIFAAPTDAENDNSNWNTNLGKLLEGANRREVYLAWDNVLDKRFGTGWREPLCQKLMYVIERTQENYDLLPQRNSDPDEQKAKMKKLKLLFHGTGAGLTSYLRKGLIPPKAEEETRYGREIIPLGESSFGSYSGQAESWTGGTPILIVDCEKINREKIHMRYQHPTYEGNISPKAIIGVVTQDNESVYVVTTIARHALSENKPELLIPVLGHSFEGSINHLYLYVQNLEEKNDGYRRCWPKLEQTDCDTLQRFADAYQQTRRR